MSQVSWGIEFTELPTDDEFELERLFAELGSLLSPLGTAEAVRAVCCPGRRGLGDFALSALTLVTRTDAGTVTRLLETLVGFIRRNPGRTVRLALGDRDWTLDSSCGQEFPRLAGSLCAALSPAGVVPSRS
jgi:hypothetical protein